MARLVCAMRTALLVVMTASLVLLCMAHGASCAVQYDEAAVSAAAETLGLCANDGITVSVSLEPRSFSVVNDTSIVISVPDVYALVVEECFTMCSCGATLDATLGSTWATMGGASPAVQALLSKRLVPVPDAIRDFFPSSGTASAVLKSASDDDDEQTDYFVFVSDPMYDHFSSTLTFGSFSLVGIETSSFDDLEPPSTGDRHRRGHRRLLGNTGFFICKEPNRDSCAFLYRQ